MKNEQQQSNNSKEGNLLYITSDQLVFFEKEHAFRHSRTLEDKAIVTMTQGEAERQLAGIGKSTSDDELEALLDELTGM